jgi:formate-dependent nitrite reductase membrane component NrfD
LLAAARPIAFWSTPMLPLLFLVSALSTGIMAIVLIASLGGGGHVGPVGALARADAALIILEILVLVFYLHGSHRVPESRAAANLVLSGSVAPLFWFGVAGLGLLIPLLLDLLGAAAVLASICGVIGGLCLRRVILSAGIHAPLRAGRFEITFPT